MDPITKATSLRAAFDNVETLTREQLIAFCVSNDPNGCYTDADCMREFGELPDTEALRQIVRDWAKDWER